MRVSLIFLILFFSGAQLLSARDAIGQDINKVYISLELKDETLLSALDKIQRLTPFTFAYNKREVKRIHNLSMAGSNRSVNAILSILLLNTDLRFEQVGNTIVISPARPDVLSSASTEEPAKEDREGDKAPKSKVITGTVTNDRGDGLSGVSVTIRGTSTGTTTDAEGRFKLTVPDEGATLEFSSVGYQKQSITTGSQVSFTIVMKENIRGLNDVVVIGYGTVKKSDLTGAVAGLRGDQLMDKPVPNVSQALEGKIAGVDVNINSNAPGFAAKVRVRGIGSINSNIDPLYVVDGVIGVDANTINPNDIASLEVLKDASSTAIYGARGANGVIMITTKRGRHGISRVTYDGNINEAELYRHVQTLNSQQFIQIYNQAYANGTQFDPLGGVWTPPVPLNHFGLPKLFDANDKPLYNTNWEKETFKPAFSNSHQLTVQGGSEKSLFSLSAGYLDQNGLMVQSWFKRYNVKLTLDHDVNDWLRMGGAINLIQSTQRVVSDANGALNVPRAVIEEVPILPVKYPDGTWAGNSDIAGLEGAPNPVHTATDRYTLNNTLQTTGDAYALVHITKDLDFKSDFGFNVSGQKNNFYSSIYLPHLSQDQGGDASINAYTNIYWQSENYLTYNKTINDRQKITALLGASWQQYNQEWVNAETQNFIDDFFQWDYLNAGSVRQNAQSQDYQWTMNSYFARFTYNIDEKYLFTLTGREDGSSKFGANNKYAFFPSAGAAWRISQEPFMQNSRLISNLKLRGSYGISGNQEIGQYRSIAQIQPNTVVLNGANQSTLSPAYIGNPNLKWERSLQADIGIELGLMKDRINLNLDLYQRTTKDLLLQAPIPWSAGMTNANVYQNVGSVRNTGIEVNLNTVNIKTQDFTWSTNFIVAVNKNKILNLNSGNADIFPGPNFLGQTNVLRVGEAIGSFYGMTRIGTYGSNEAALAASHGLHVGDRKYIYNKDGSPYYSIIGHAYPDWTGTLSSTMTYRGWDFTFDIRFVEGVNTAATFKHSSEDRQTIANSLATVLNGWTPQHQNTMISEVRNYKFAQDSHFDTWWVEDGSFIRGQNFILGYTFPERTVRSMKLSKLRAYVSVQNLFLSTKYTGYDPEVDTYFSSYGANTGFSQNLDFFSYPRPRIWNFGVSVGL
ncbi:TonB-dependent receptor [Puia dinghuensis]|uniref:SusC/RagA family TonB-linked outer membrane protein n=1 Tax=Puia dinghuensis TaxID=1792502 RepID=A0A8J2XPW5_9BACT|nr:TonB-dependent receptor [Puia dinghuensis]GGA82229.1 SusC/RagA family TonB-linked outer membrane protein [Puia dinghuensis]